MCTTLYDEFVLINILSLLYLSFWGNRLPLKNLFMFKTLTIFWHLLTSLNVSQNYKRKKYNILNRFKRRNFNVNRKKNKALITKNMKWGSSSFIWSRMEEYGGNFDPKNGLPKYTDGTRKGQHFFYHFLTNEYFHFNNFLNGKKINCLMIYYILNTELDLTPLKIESPRMTPKLKNGVSW